MQIATNDVEFSAPIPNAHNIATAHRSHTIETSETTERLPRQSAKKLQSLKKIPFQVISGSPLALAEACAPSEIGQYLDEGRVSLLPRPIFRGQDLTMTITNAGRSIDFHGAKPFRISSVGLAMLSKRTKLYKQFQRGDTVRLACRYLSPPGMDHRLDLFQDTLLREGKMLLNNAVPPDIGEGINYRRLVLDIGKSDPTEIFKRETRKVLAEIARATPELLSEVEAVLWFPQNSILKQAIRVDITH